MNISYILILIIVLYENIKGNKISKIKCLEYSKFVYVNQTSPILIGKKSIQNRISECGIVSVPLIIKGSRANEKEFPHMAYLAYGPNSSHILVWGCGGSLISENFVLSAAHCKSLNKFGNAQIAYFGSIDRTHPKSHLQKRIINEIIVHPDYKNHKLFNDIALFRLNSSVNFTPYVRPACINNEINISNQNAIAIGFGSVGGNVTNSFLMKTILPILTNDKCSYIKKSMTNIFDKTIVCAGELNGRDTCGGDSGGPLLTVLKYPYCMYNIIGITSFGVRCGVYPGVYTKVANYVSWIESIVWK